MTKQNGLDQFDASDFVDASLSTIPSTFGKLVFMAGLLRGRHVEQIDSALRRKHREIFFAWLGLSLMAQMADVRVYLAEECRNNDTTIAKLIQQWVQENLYERLRPAAATESEWALFSCDVRATLQLLLIRLGSSEGCHRG
jgi:hypothetical protein